MNHPTARTTVRLLGGTLVAAVASLALCGTAAAGTPAVTGTASLVNLDLDGDGTDDATAYDSDGNGVFESLLYDSTGDTVTDFSLFDDNQNGVAERAEVDRDHDGTADLFGTDADEDMVWDSFTEAGGVRNGDTIEDLVGSMTSVVGPSTPDGLSRLILGLAGQTGQVAYGTPDSDGDLYDDAHDARPFDNQLH